MKTYTGQQTKHRLRHNISKHVNFQSAWNCMGPLNGEIKLQVNETNNKN